MRLGRANRNRVDGTQRADSGRCTQRFVVVIGIAILCMAAECTPPKLGTVIAEHGEGCQGSGIHNVKCATGLSCLGYQTPAVDLGYGGSFCEVPCNTSVDCPEGYQCSIVSDGPWQVCTQSTTEDALLAPEATVLGPSVPGVEVDPSTDTTVVYDDTTLYSSKVEPHHCMLDGKEGAPDVMVQFEAPATGVYRFWLDPSVTQFDAILYLSTAYPVTPNNCTAVDDSTFPVMGNDKVNMLLHQGENILVVVDGKETYDWISDYPNGGPFKLVITLE